MVHLLRNSSIAAAAAAAASAAAVLVASSIGPTLAQAVDHSHEVAAPKKLTLNQGKKWGTDEPLWAGMERIRGLVEPQLGAAHNGKITPAQYGDLATRIKNGKNPKQPPALGLVKVAQTLDQYGKHFEHPASSRSASVIDRSRRLS